MPSRLEWYGDEVFEEIEEDLATRLLRAASFFYETHHRFITERYATPPNFLDPSKPGEYPKARSGGGADSLTWDPKTPEEIAANGFRVQIGYLQNAFYMVVLELSQHRKGLLDTLSACEPQLKALAVAGSEA